MIRERYEYVQPDSAIAKIYEESDVVVCDNCGAWLLVPVGLPPDCNCVEKK